MNSSPPPSPSDPDSGNDSRRNANEPDFEGAIAEVERSLAGIKERYAQIQGDEARQAELLQRQKQVKQEMRHSRDRQLREELRQIQQELESIELNLESSLFSWDSLKEPFWQAVRFGGLGIVIGWILKSCAG